MDTTEGTYAIKQGDIHMMVDRKYINKTGYLQLDCLDSNQAWILPLPDTLEYSASWDWEESNIRTIVDAAGTSNWDTVWNQGLALLSDKIETIPYGLGNVEAGQLHRQLTEHRTKNLNPRLFFSGQPKQDFAMNFTIVPFSQDHEDQMVVGLQSLMIESTPEADEASAESFWKLPSMFKSRVFSPGSEEGNIPPIITRPKFVIRGINIAALDSSVHPSGLPVSFKLTINCLEFDFITKFDRQNILL